jgi:CHAT domain-containing protein
MLEFLKEQQVDHIVLIPDPHYMHVPYLMLLEHAAPDLALRTTLSIASSALELCTISARYKEALVPAEKVVLFAPDAQVNESRGGDSESEMLTKLFAAPSIRGSSATVSEAVKCIAAGNWVHFRGHGRWDALPQNRGPVCSDGVLTLSALEGVPDDAGAVLVTAACATGFGIPLGTESFGSLAEYDAVGLRAAVLTLWPIAGDAATPFFHEVYDRAASGHTLASALHAAALWIRSRAPHPFFWAAFVLVGAWSTALRVRPGRSADEPPT